MVDDSATMRRMIIASLTPIGELSFDQAVSGLEAIERMTLSPVDLVMLDLNMPDVHGIEVLRFIRGHQNLRALPVVVLTTSAAERDLLKSYDLHANAYIVKPIDLDQFIDVVQAIETFWFSIVKLPPAPDD